MKKAVSIIILLLSTAGLKAQSNVDVKTLTRAIDTVIGFQCGTSDTKVVRDFKSLLTNSNYAEIRKRLDSKNAAVKFLSAIACNKLNGLEKIVLNDSEKIKIKEIYNSNDTVYGCAGCTYISARPIREYVSKKDDDAFIKKLEFWIESLIQ